MELGFFLKKKLYLSQELNGYQFDGHMKWSQNPCLGIGNMKL